MRPHLVASSLVLVACLALGGCGSDEQPKAASTPSAEPSQKTPPGLDTTAPTLPADQAETPASAEEYAEYLTRLVQYAVRTRSARPVYAEAFDQGQCVSCTQLDTFVQDLQEGGYWEIGDDVELGDYTASRSKDGFTVKGAFVYPKADYVTVDGTSESTVTQKPYRITADLTWDASGERWRVLDYVYRSVPKQG